MLDYSSIANARQHSLPPAWCRRALQEFANFGRGVIDFALLGVPAAIVNSGLKFMQKNLELSFQSRLTLYLHKLYTSNRAYYAASTLGGLTHADQRITEDVEKFCFSISDLYSHTFKVRWCCCCCICAVRQ